MSDLLSEFIYFMVKSGCGPHCESDIKADNKRRNFTIAGDPVNKKNGFYKFSISENFAFGYFGNYKDGGASFSWNSSHIKDYNEADLKALRKKIREDAKKEEEELRVARDLAARDAQNYCMFLDEVVSHPYLDKKKIEACGALVKGENLVLPMSDGEQICNYQIIKADSSKKYYPNAKKTGCFYLIPGTGKKVYIAEGFATAASVHMATGAPVYVAFDSGNLGHVAAYVISSETGKTIIVAADNDHETVINEKPFNTGIQTAEKVKKLYGIGYIYPEFTADDKKCSDFNDFHVKYGLEALKNILRATRAAEEGADDRNTHAKNLPTRSSAPTPAPSDTWKNDLLRDGKNRVLIKSNYNASLVLSMDPCFHGAFCRDDFEGISKVIKPLPWDDEDQFEVRQINDCDYVRAQLWLERHYGFICPKGTCADLIENIANARENRINPATEYFNSIRWDGIERLGTWLERYVYDQTGGFFGPQSPEYLQIVGRRFMIGLASRAMYPGCKFDTMLVLEGRQYGGKSTLSKMIGTIEGKEYFIDGIKDINNKDSLDQMRGKLVIEFDEIAAMRRAEINELKGFLSRQTDTYRPAYGRNNITVPRQCVFIGTVNPSDHYLKDVTGNRRYLPIACRNKIPLDEIKAIMPQLHAEAAHYARDGEDCHLHADEFLLAVEEQSKRTDQDAWTNKIELFVSGKEFIPSDDIMDYLRIDTERRTGLFASRISGVMTSLGYVPDRRRVGNRRLRGFSLKSSKVNLLTDLEEDGGVDVLF